MENYPLVSIVIPTMNRAKSLIQTLKSLSHLNYSKNKIEMIIIDNGSIDNTLIKLQNPKTPSKIKIIINKKNIGFAPALNQGIKVSRGKYVLVTNDDVAFDKECLLELVKLADSDNKIGIVSGRMFFKDFPKRMAMTGFRVNLWLGYHPYDFKGKNKVREMDVATGGCILIRKSMLAKIGLFDEGFFFCGEDYDICFRAKYAGFKIIYCPTAILWHDFLGSGKNTPEALFAHYRGKFRFMLIHASLFQLIFFSPTQLIIGYKNLLPMSKALSWNLNTLNRTLVSRKKINKLKVNLQ